MEPKAICPKCRSEVGLRTGKRLLKHGHSNNPYHSRPPCKHSGEKVTDADILVWCRREADLHERYVSMDRDNRVRAEEALAFAQEKEQKSMQDLQTVRSILAEYEGKVTT